MDEKIRLAKLEQQVADSFIAQEKTLKNIDDKMKTIFSLLNGKIMPAVYAVPFLSAGLGWLFVKVYR